jgi:HlyD family secretion protein
MKFPELIVLGIGLFLSLSSCNDEAELYKIKGQRLNDCIYASGEIIPEDYFQLSTPKATNMLEVLVREGDVVPKGKVLAILGTVEDIKLTEINQRQLDATRGNAAMTSAILEDMAGKIVLARSKYEMEKKNMEIYKVLFLKQALSRFEMDQQYIKFESSRAEYFSFQKQYAIKKQDLNYLSKEQEKSLIKSREVLRSPISGKIFTVNKREGEIAAANETVITIGKIRDYKLELLIDERDIRKVKFGQTVFFESDIYPGKPLKATISRIYPELQKETRSFKVDAKILERDLVLYPGSAVEANIVWRTKVNAIRVSKKFLSAGNILHVKTAGKTSEVKVETGSELNGWIEITKGLKIGDLIVLPEN